MSKNEVNLFNGMTKESQRLLLVAVNNVTPSELSFDEPMKELNK